MVSQFFSRWQKRTEYQQLREILSHAQKRLRRDKDLLTQKQEVAFSREIQKAQNALTAQITDIPKVTAALVDAYNRYFPSQSGSFWRENGEVILVALVIAMAIRAFFLQPFKIPTGSMQPTLNGITVRSVNPKEQEQTWWYRLICFPVFGENILHFVTKDGGSFKKENIKPVKFGPLHYGGKNGFLNLLPIDGVEFYIGDERYTLPVDVDHFFSQVLGPDNPSEKPLMKLDQVFQPGDTILDCVVQTGDQLFVDRFTYNFRKPKRADVFVFETNNLPVRHPGDFYIKRLAGLPGDTLQIQDLDLYINNQKATESGFQRVMSRKNGYRGYSYMRLLNHSTATYTLEPGRYFALGDNSFRSSDSRDWGSIPYQNIVGRGFFVYWPFTRHFGRIE